MPFSLRSIASRRCILVVRTMSLYKTFYKLWDTLGENEGIETFAMTLDRVDAINVKKIPLPAS